MARELLDWAPVPDLTKCDIFSLGITALEIVSGIQVASEGEEWHLLRSGIKSDFAILHGVPLEVQEILVALMAATPSERPSAHACLESFANLKSDLERELMYQKKYAEQLRSQLNSRAITSTRRRNTVY